MAKIAKVQEVAVADLRPYDRNAKTHGADQVDKIAESIREFGFISPCLIDKELNIIAGHGRVMAAKKLGMETVPCVFIEGLTEAQRRAYILADNRLTELGGWDMELVQSELLELKDMDFNIDLTGFELEQESVEIVETDIPEPPAEPTTKRGYIYILGRHRLMCGDSTSQEDVRRLMNGMSADMLLTDPPYNVEYTGKTKDALTIQNDKQGDDQFRAFLTDAFTAAAEVMKPGAVFYIWHADSEGFNFRYACMAANLTVKQCLIWNKNSMVLGRQDYQWKHEPCLYGWKEGASHLWASDRKQTTVLDFDRPNRNAEHPTMKPVALFDYQMQNNTKGGDIVLDLFGGSGTTIIAAEQNGRCGYAMELDPKYCDVIVKRWEDLTGEKAVLADG